MLEDELNLIFADGFIFIDIVAVKGYLELLLLVAHEGQKEKFNELIMIDSLVSIRIYLVDYSIANNFRQVQIVFHHLDTDVILVGPRYETHKNRAQIRHQNLLHKVSILFRHEVLNNYRVRISRFDQIPELFLQHFQNCSLLSVH